MDLKDLGAALAKIGLPMLGAALPIPGGAAIGTALAAAIGAKTDSPDDILAKLTTSPEALQAAREFQARHEERMLELTTQAEIESRKADSADIAAVNETMRTESENSDKESWYQKGWRPFNGFVVGAASMVTVAGVLWLAWLALVAKDLNALNAIPTIVSSIAMVLAIPGAAVGITAWHRGVAQRIALTK